jgi:PAS domain S-box-containing protein
MRLGIKRKILLVLVTVLAFSFALLALLASYFTNQQNEESAFANLDRDLLAWRNDLQTQTLRLQRVALSASSDPVLLNQLAELVTLELNVDDPLREKEAPELAKTLSYSKAVSLNRLHLVQQAGGFSSIGIYTGNKLSHYVADTGAGMQIHQGKKQSIWIQSDPGLAGEGNFQSWPAWPARPPPAAVARSAPDVARPTVSFVFLAPDLAAIEIAVPVQGLIEEFLRDAAAQPLSRFVSELAIAGKGTPARQSATLATLVYRKLIDRAVMEDLAAKTGKWPVLFSPDGSHQQQLADRHRTPAPLLRQAQAMASASAPQVVRQTVATDKESFYEALLPLQFDGRTRLILGLSSSRDSTIENIRQTVTAILLAAGLILVASIAIATFWVGRFIDPIVALTEAVRRIGIKRQLAASQIGADDLQPIAIRAPDEIGELSAAFDVMIAELRHAIETLEQRVQERTAALRQQTRYLRTLIDTLPLWVWLKDTQHRYLAINQANADACGRSIDDMLGKSDTELWPPAIAERYRADDMEVMAALERKTVEELFDGEAGAVWMETSRAPVLDEDGTVLGIVGAARNISERKAAEEAREKALAEAVLLARQRSEFLAQMSHELRTPLNAILGYAQILQRDPHLSKRQTVGLATIHESGQHLLTLINDILDLARVEAGKLSLDPGDLDLGNFLRIVGDIIRVKAEEKSLFFDFRAAPELPAAVRADEQRLRQVLLNLLGNAVKFTDRGQVVLRVLRVATSGNDPATARLRFEVDDSGIGMSGEQLARIFQPFEQVSEIRRREAGTGLGLAISQQLVWLMGGEIHVSSELGQGSRFWFELDLPVAKPVLSELSVRSPILAYEGPRKKILVVDDVPHNRAMLIEALQALGFCVLDAKNGAECLEMLGAVRPDLIVMDVMMPVMGGREAARAIRTMPEFAGIPIIIVTASATVDDEAKSLEAGANAFIPKPIALEILLKHIGELLSLTWIHNAVPGESAEETGDFVVPPQDEIEKLCQLARLGDMEMIRASADYLKQLDPRYIPFASRLRQLAESYQSKAITTLVERYRSEPFSALKNTSAL